MEYPSSFLLSIIILEHTIDLEKVKEDENDQRSGRWGKTDEETNQGMLLLNRPVPRNTTWG